MTSRKTFVQLILPLTTLWLLTLLLIEETHSRNFAVGYPDHTIRWLKNYVTNYNHKHRIPDWVVEHLEKKELDSLKKIEQKKATKHMRPGIFSIDNQIRPPFQIKHTDYTCTKDYDRGHMAACDIHQYEREQMRQTFLTSNIAPQTKALNRGPWKQVETFIQHRALMGDVLNVYIATGPVFKPEGDKIEYTVMSMQNLAVATHFFKVVLFHLKDDNGHESFKLKSYMLQNSKKGNLAKEPKTGIGSGKADEAKVKEHEVDLEIIEGLVGFKIFPRRFKDLTSTNSRQATCSNVS